MQVFLVIDVNFFEKIFIFVLFGESCRISYSQKLVLRRISGWGHYQNSMLFSSVILCTQSRIYPVSIRKISAGSGIVIPRISRQNWSYHLATIWLPKLRNVASGSQTIQNDRIAKTVAAQQVSQYCETS